MLNLPKISKQHLIIFTRYPEPGKTKTRLIPALGTEGAANIQRQMTEHTLLQVSKLQNTANISVEIRFAGGNSQLMQNWLGSGILYQSQSEGDLGQRMARSLFCAFEAGAQQVVIIGTDCPSINPEILANAFEQLHAVDLVLGPAADGGYYLIGLCRFIPELFTGIDWGTGLVWQQTVEIAQFMNLSSVYLPTLTDIDRPEDLHIWKS
ncbi:MAG: TIGR04282 family arsenosugar biosynthesis glycosyltransferase [Nostocaceae cyanobacterium]|nr:TIGR04282 family arsenosugar biosynthesis glycosyltransferase [Nostocaceae cyanobacterium]